MSMVHVTGVARLPGVSDPVSSIFDFALIIKMGKQGNFRGKKASKKGIFFKKKIPRFVNNIL